MRIKILKCLYVKIRSSAIFRLGCVISPVARYTQVINNIYRVAVLGGPTRINSLVRDSQNAIFQDMSSFPPDSWDCRPLADLDTYVAAALQSRNPQLTAMLAIR
jgi:hypothetical protein